MRAACEQSVYKRQNSCSALKPTSVNPALLFSPLYDFRLLRSIVLRHTRTHHCAPEEEKEENFRGDSKVRCVRAHPFYRRFDIGATRP